MADPARVTITVAPNQAALDAVLLALKPLSPVPLTSLELQPSQISVKVGLAGVVAEARLTLETESG